MNLDNSHNEINKNTILFARLVLTFHNAAMQQMGKIVDPVSGKIKRSLPDASLSINTLDMLRDRCSGNLKPDEQRLIDQIVAELKLNYIDECSRTETFNVEQNEQDDDAGSGIQSGT